MCTLIRLTSTLRTRTPILTSACAQTLTSACTQTLMSAYTPTLTSTLHRRYDECAEWIDQNRDDAEVACQLIDQHGRGVLFYASAPFAGDAAVTHKILSLDSARAAVNLRDDNGETALHFAVSS